jgi:hypothetical protein
VRIRRRKPCVLARRRLFGWKVRLLTLVSYLESGRTGPVVGEPEPVGCHRKPTTPAGSCALAGAVTGMRKQPTNRRVNGTRERHRGSNQPNRYPGLGKEPRIARSTARPPERHTHGDHAAYPQSVDNHVDGGWRPRRSEWT